MKFKKISSGLIITNGDVMLICHVTGQQNVWDIPKGCVKEHELHIDACVREVYEETAINLIDKKNDFIDCGVIEYIKSKDLHLYIYNTKSLPTIDEMDCFTYFTKNGHQYKELDKYLYVKLIDVHSYVRESLYKCLSSVLNI